MPVFVFLQKQAFFGLSFLSFVLYLDWRGESLRRIIITAAFLAGTLFFSGCGDMNLLFPFGDEDTDRSYLQVSIDSGAIVPVEKQISVDLKETEESRPLPVKLIVTMYDKNNRQTGQPLSIDELTGGAIPAIVPTAGSRGYHRIHFELFDEAGKLLESRDVDFFYEEDAYVIDSLKVFPAGSIAPGAAGLLFASASALEDAYFRWSSGKDIFARGMVSDFMDGALWTAPDKAGVYPVTVELFPEPPPEHFGGDYPFTSPVSRSVDLYVDPEPGPVPGALKPDDAYRALFHFHGTLENSAVAGEEDPAAVNGSPRPFVHDGVFGYRFSGGDSLEIPLSGQPVDNVRINYFADSLEPGAESILFRILDRNGTSLAFVFTGTPSGVPPSLRLLTRRPEDGDSEYPDTLYRTFSPEEEESTGAVSFVGKGSWILRREGVSENAYSISVLFEYEGNVVFEEKVDDGSAYPIFRDAEKVVIGGADLLFLDEFGILIDN